MPSLINKLPTGLLSFLQSVAFGVNPRVLLDEVRPVLDLDAFLSAGEIDGVSTSFAMTAVGQTNAITIPQSELWRIHWIGVQNAITTISVADIRTVVTASVPLASGGSLVMPIAVQPDQKVINAGIAIRQMSFAFFPPQRMFLQPGTEIRCTAEDLLLGVAPSILNTMIVVRQAFLV
jgi:hypothetical protein